MKTKTRVHVICAAVAIVFALVFAGPAGSDDTGSAAKWLQTGGPPPGSQIRAICSLASSDPMRHSLAAACKRPNSIHYQGVLNP